METDVSWSCPLEPTAIAHINSSQGTAPSFRGGSPEQMMRGWEVSFPPRSAGIEGADSGLSGLTEGQNLGSLLVG